MTDEELESMEIDWTQGVAENFERVKSAALAALDAANKRADEAEARRKCYECGSEMTACAQCNPELVSAELATLRARVAELEARRKCYECGSEMTAEELEAIRKREAELDNLPDERIWPSARDRRTLLSALDAAIERAEKAEALVRLLEDDETVTIITALRALVERLDEQYADKVDGLESDLSSAVDVIYRRGDDEAREWVRLNYPKQYAALKEKNDEQG